MRSGAADKRYSLAIIRALMTLLINSIITVLALFSSLALADDLPQKSRPDLLSALDGHWVMIGDVRGKPVKYTLSAAPILQGKYSELQMKDVNIPAKYEAKVIIGSSQDGGSLIVHWIDSFGASYSVPHGIGQVLGDTIEFSFSYSGGKFRDVLRKNNTTNSWSLKIEAEQKDGTWQHFAQYEITKE